MTPTGSDAPPRTLTQSKKFWAGALALLLVLDIVLILWMTSARESAALRFINPLKSPLQSADNAARTGTDRRTAPSAQSNPQKAGQASRSGSGGAAVTVREPAAPVADDGTRLLESLGASAEPPSMRGFTPPRPGTPAAVSRPGSAVVAAPRGDAVRVPGLPSGVFVAQPPSASGTVEVVVPPATGVTVPPGSGVSQPPGTAPLQPAPSGPALVVTAPSSPATVREPAPEPPRSAAPIVDPTPPAATREPEPVRTPDTTPKPQRTKDPEPVVVDPTPVVVDPTPVVVDPTPVVVDPTPVVVDPTPDETTEETTKPKPTDKPTGRATNAPPKCEQSPCTRP